MVKMSMSHAMIMLTVRGNCDPVSGFHGHQNGSSSSGGAPVYRICTPLFALVLFTSVKLGGVL